MSRLYSPLNAVQTSRPTYGPLSDVVSRRYRRSLGKAMNAKTERQVHPGRLSAAAEKVGDPPLHRRLTAIAGLAFGPVPDRWAGGYLGS
jgi:hypothetical protein